MSGRGTAQTKIHDQQKWLPTEGGILSETKGEAAVVDLKTGGALAALMRGTRIVGASGLLEGDYNAWAGWEILAPGSNWTNGRNRAFDELKRAPGSPSAEVPPELCPLMAFFPDRLKPTAIILPANPADWARVLRTNITGGLSVTLTQDPLFRDDPARVLPWLDSEVAIRADTFDGRSIDIQKYDLARIKYLP